MNCASSECESFCQSDLVFKMSGGAYSGKTLPIKTQKCILAFDCSTGLSQQSRCAIFRGDGGVSVRNLDNRVMVNGEFRQEHWLQLGDRIEFPNSVVLEVSQLGYKQRNESAHNQDELEQANSSETNFHSAEFEPSANSLALAVDEEAPALTDFPHQEQNESFDSEPNSRLQAEVSSEVLSSVENRFHEIEERLNQLADQISSLVTLASCGKLSSTALKESDWDKQVNRFSVDPTLPTTALDAAVDTTSSAPPAESFAPSNRFNVADFGPAVETGKAEPNARADHQEIECASPAENISDNNQDSLVPTRRVSPETNGSEVEQRAESTATSSSPSPFSVSGLGLTELMNSLASSDSISSEAPAIHSSVPQSNVDSESKFSVAGASETLSIAMPQQNSPTKPPSVDEEIDALLSRLFEASSTESQVPIPATQNQSFESEGQVLEANFEPVAELANPGKSETDSVEPTTQAELSYANMKFGYSIEPKETGPEGVNREIIVAATENATTADMPGPLAETGSENKAGESVMDLLARLKQDGCWDESDNASEKAKSASQLNPSEKVEEEKKETMLRTSVSDKSEPAASVQVDNRVTAPASGGNDSVEDYMNQLLARMNVGLEAPDDSKTKEQKNAANAKLAQSALEIAQPNSELMTAEEYVPKQKAAKIESLETMREIANSTARTAVAYSDLDRKKARGIVQAVIACGAFIMSALYFLLWSKAFFDTAFVVGTICLIATAAFGYMAFTTLKGTGFLKDLFPNPKER